MSTCLRLLQAILWTLPIQRACTVLGFGGALGLAAVNALAGPSNALFFAMLTANVIGAAPAMLLGGGLLRAVSAPRVVSLAPRNRARLLAAGAGVVATIALWEVLCYLLFFAVLAPGRRMGLPGYGEIFFSAVLIGMLAGLFSFFSSRSPLAMLISLGVCIAGAYWFGPDGAARAWAHDWWILAPVAVWLAFATWYLRARRIAPPGWLLPGGQSVFAAVTITDATLAGASGRSLLERLLLGGTTAPRIAMQWLLAGGLLLGWLLFLARRAGDQAGITAHFAFGALLLCPAIVAAQSLAAVQRSRALWLVSGYSRTQLLAFIERTLARFASGMTLVFAIFLLVLWYALPWHPDLTLPEALLAMLLPSLQLATLALVRPRGWEQYWRWPLAILLCWFIAWKPLTASDPTGWTGPRVWPWFVAAVIAIIAFHLTARRRWQVEDLPRATSRSSAS